MDTIKKRVTTFLAERSNWHFLALCFALLMLIGLQVLPNSEVPTASQPEEQQLLGDLLEKDYVAVPIEIANADSITEIIGAFGFVDLYTQDQTQRKRTVRIAKAVRIVRSESGQGFSAIVNEAESLKIIQATPPLVAIIRSPQSSNQQQPTTKKQKIWKEIDL